MIRRRGRFHRQMIVLSSMAGSTLDLVQGLWRGHSGRRWLAPLAVFLCLTGAVLILAVTVEALAPFVYAIF
jgi:hypothetical protein